MSVNIIILLLTITFKNVLNLKHKKRGIKIFRANEDLMEFRLMRQLSFSINTGPV